MRSEAGDKHHSCLSSRRQTRELQDAPHWRARKRKEADSAQFRWGEYHCAAVGVGLGSNEIWVKLYEEGLVKPQRTQAWRSVSFTPNWPLVTSPCRDTQPGEGQCCGRDRLGSHIPASHTVRGPLCTRIPWKQGPAQGKSHRAGRLRAASFGGVLGPQRPSFCTGAA